MVCTQCGFRPGRTCDRKSERENQKTISYGRCGRFYVSDGQWIITQERRKNSKAEKTLSMICVY